MRVYILQECELNPHANSILGLKSRTTKGAVPTEKEAIEWCEAQIKEKLPFCGENYAKKIKHENGQVFGYRYETNLFMFEEFELKIGIEELTGVGLYDKAFNKALEWARGDKSKVTVDLVHTFLYNMLFYDTNLKVIVLEEGSLINKEGMARGAETARKNMEKS